VNRPGVLIADDHILIAEALRALLEPEYQVLDLVHDGKKLLSRAVELKPEIVILDLGMPLLNGIDAGQQLKKILPRTKFVVVTMNEDPDVASVALHNWASGYLLKKSAGTELKRALDLILRGRTYVTPSIAQPLMDEFIRNPKPAKDKELTPRQREVLQLLAEGRSMKEAAAVLDVAVRTIAFHKYKIMEEFGLKSNAELVRFALHERLVAEDPRFS